MSRIIRPDARLVQEFVYTQQQLPTHKPVVQYIRQSTDTQVEENEDSTYMQDEELAERLKIMGFTKIIPIDIDQGISGQKRLDERKGLQNLYKLISDGKVGAVAAYDASRLWRDTTHIWYNTFIEDYLKKYDIPVIFSGEDDVRVFWPKRQQDMDMLREEFKQAAFFLRQIDKLKEAKKRAIEKRVSYGGGSVPFGYILATTSIAVGAKMKKRHYYVIYEPHAKLVRWLFQRFKELDGNLSRLGRELREIGFSFPPFQGIDRKPHVSLRFDGAGYPLTTRDALVSILTNPAYIGWYVYNGVIVSKTAHDPIIEDLDLFMYAYSRLSLTTLDGQPNEERPSVERRFVKIQALLEGLLTADGAPVYALSASQTYTARIARDGWSVRHEFGIDIRTLDNAFQRAIITLLVSLEQRAKEGLRDSLHDQLKALQEEKTEKVISLDSAVTKINNAIHGWELDKQSCRETGNKAGLDEANRQLKRLYADRAALETKAKAAGHEQEELAETQSLLQQAINDWNALPFEKQKRFVRMLVSSANITKVSPRIVKIDVSLRYLDCVMTGYAYLDTLGRSKFTGEELEVIKRLYPHADRLDMLKALPDKSWHAIKRLAQSRGLQRVDRMNSAPFHEELSYADFLVMQEVELERNYTLWNIPDAEIAGAFRRALSAHQNQESLS